MRWREWAAGATLMKLTRRRSDVIELAPGEAARIRKTVRDSRFDIEVDPEVQPECDFDPGEEA